MTPTIADLHHLLRLDHETGRLFWRTRTKIITCWDTANRLAVWNKRHAGAEAFTSNKEGYRSGKIFSRTYGAHRVVFALANGRWPEGQVDHIDGNGANNKPDNLREATKTDNARNRGSKIGTSRFCGVSWHKPTGKWQAQCRGDAGRRYLGLFSDEAEAAKAYDAAASELHGQFARLNFVVEITTP